MEKNSPEYTLENLQIEHRDLDQVIKLLSIDPESDGNQITRLKKRKLAIKDQIIRLKVDVNSVMA
tara:strand:+ start:4111 stop:4305 length:195 start_codon:yes stop_codon:yes gene_type:complete